MFLFIDFSWKYFVAAHWDGFQPFGNKKRSTGAIEVSIATMSKEDRLCTEEIYTVGFVPSYDLPEARPNSIDPFLEPLVRDLEEGFIEGRTNWKGFVIITTSHSLDSSYNLAFESNTKYHAYTTDCRLKQNQCVAVHIVIIS